MALEARGLPMFDDVRTVPFIQRETHLAQAQRVLDDLRPGLSYLIIHPSTDSPELRAILPQGWSARVADYEVFLREDLREFVASQGIHIITWRILRDLMRAQIQ